MERRLTFCNPNTRRSLLRYECHDEVHPAVLLINRLSSVLNNLARTPTDKAEHALDVWDMSNHHSAVIDLLKVNLLATSPKEFRDYAPALRNARHCQTHFAGLRAIDSPRL